ncbi:MAG: hypothetical protein HY820_25315 [Acidobacteria bacterium]|nr:hypothetical protein [Acidobacteriota bacterium]
MSANCSIVPINRFALVLAIFAIGASSACTRRSAAEGRVNSIETNRKSLRTVQGRIAGEKADQPEVPYTAYFQQMELQLIEEQKEGSPLQGRFYFVEGKLFYFREVNGGQIARQFIIDRRGKLVGTQPAPFPDQDYRIIAARAEKLKDQAMQRAGHMFVFPLMRNR